MADGSQTQSDNRSEDEKAAHESDASQNNHARAPLWKNPRVIIGASVAGVVIVIGVLAWWLHSRKFENTDDAFVDAHIVRLSPKASGQVIRVFVRDNDFVHAGDEIAEIDPADARARFEQAQAQYQQATSSLAQINAQIAAAEATEQQAKAALDAAKAESQRGEKDFERVRALRQSAPEAVAQEQFDQIATAARSSQAQREGAERQLRAANAQTAAARAQLVVAQAKIAEAQAQVDEAQLGMSYTKITAPIDGHVAQTSIAVGSYVAPGQQILALVPTNVWITANFKETQLTLMRVGQNADVKVDACPRVDIHGHVDSIQRGAGQAFGILPPENATGNYVKVVQRVPVKIVLDQVPRNCVLGPGMSVVPKVRIR